MESDKCLHNAIRCFLWIGFICFTLIMVGCIYIFTKSCDNAKSEIVPIQQCAIKIVIEQSDSSKIASSGEFQKFSSAVADYNDAIIESNKMTLNEFRTEADKAIDRANSWMGFWIAALSFLGIIIPIVLQYKASADYKQELKAKVYELNSMKKELKEAQKKAESKIQSNIDVASKEVGSIIQEANETKDQYNIWIEHVKFQSLIDCLSTGIDNKLFLDSTERDKYRLILMGTAVESYKTLVELILKKPIDDRASKEILYQSLIQLHGILTRFVPTVPRKPNRKYQQAIVQIVKVLEKIDQYSDKSALCKDLSEIEIMMMNLFPTMSSDSFSKQE